MTKEKVVELLNKHQGYLGKKQIPALAEEIVSLFQDNTLKMETSKTSEAQVSKIVTDKGSKAFVATGQ